MRNTNFYVKHGWMVNELKLKSTDLDVYAIIYGFCQDEESEYSGSIKYLAQTTGCSERTIMRSLNKLTDNGFLLKGYVIKNNGRYSSYKINFQKIDELYQGGGCDKLSQGDVTKCHKGGCDKLSPNNINNNYNNYNNYPSISNNTQVLNNNKKNSSIDENKDLFSTTTVFDDFETIWNKFCSKAGGNTHKCQKLTPKRKHQLKAIMELSEQVRKQQNSDKSPIKFLFEDIIIAAWSKSDYLNGEKRAKGYDTPLPFTIDFVLNIDHFTRMIEFLYDKK